MSSISTNLWDGVATITLTAAQIIALHSAPVEVIPGVAGKLIVPTAIRADYAYGSTTYALAMSAAVDLLYNANIGAGDAMGMSAFFDALLVLTASDTGFAMPAVAGLADSAAHVVGSGISLYSTVGNLTTGDGTLKLTIHFKMI